ncbi:MAG: hypothetical protein Q9219_002584 [cf. Caloplaca sp. 3 TL-2023]
MAAPGDVPMQTSSPSSKQPIPSLKLEEIANDVSLERHPQVPCIGVFDDLTATALQIRGDVHHHSTYDTVSVAIEL